MVNKKGILGLDTVKLVMLALLILAVLSIAAFMATSTLRDAFETAETKQSSYVVNESIILTDNYKRLAADYYVNPSCTIAAVANTTDGMVVHPNNYSQQTGLSCRMKILAAKYNNSGEVRITYTYTYNTAAAREITGNLTIGPINVFKNAPTFMVLLGVVVLILIIAIVIVAVSRFTGIGEGGISMAGGGGGEMNEGL